MPEILKSQKAYSLKNVAAQIDVSVPFIRKEIRNGNLKAKKVGARVLVLSSELDRYLEDGMDWVPADSNGETDS